MADLQNNERDVLQKRSYAKQMHMCTACLISLACGKENRYVRTNFVE